jgi:hypothetical protein
MVAECRVFLSALTSEFGMARDVVANDLQARDLQLLQATNQLAEAEPVMRRHLAIFIEFERRPDIGARITLERSSTTPACCRRWVRARPISKRRSPAWRPKGAPEALSSAAGDTADMTGADMPNTATDTAAHSSTG